MKSSNKFLLSAVLSTLIAAPLAAHADTFLFNPTGAGSTGAVSADLIDQAPGNALAQGVATQQANGSYAVTAGTNFNLYYQANLSVLKSGSEIVFANGLNATKNYFTFTAGFGETVKSADATTGSAQFAFNPNGAVNFFRIYAASAPGNDLTGLGFTTPKLILEGRIVGEPTSSFNINTGAAPVQLDQFGNNDYPGKFSVTGSGASAIDVLVSFADKGYFPGLDLASLISTTFNTSAVVPFNEANPSACFASRTADCAIQYSTGSVNGFNGSDFLLQADANEAIRVTTATKVPEPATTAMLGLGLALMGLFGISRKKNQA